MKKSTNLFTVCLIALFFGVTQLQAQEATNPKSSAIANENDYATSDEIGLMKGFPPPPEKRVDRSSLLSGPGNRWSYLNMRQLYPTAGIKNADVPVPLKKSMDGAIEKLKIQKPGAAMVDVDTWLKETYSDAVVVVHGDKVVFERYLNSMDADHPHQMMSVTKSFAGLFGLLAVADGKVKESDEVAKIIPELKKSGAFAEATFGQVLDMTSSMDFSEDYDDPESDMSHYIIVLGMQQPIEGRTYANSIYEYLPTLQIDKKYAHGEVFCYQTPKADMVNWVNNRVTGKSFQESMHEKLWSKIGTNGETYVLLDKSATLFAGGGLNATPNDLARFGMMMINDGKSTSGEQIVPASVIKTLSKGGDREAYNNGPSATIDGWSYRAQWWIRHTPGKESFSAIGVHGQWIYIDVKRKVAIIKQSSQPVSDDPYYDDYNINAFDSIIKHLANLN